MKIKLIAISILMAALLLSCQKKEQEPKQQRQTDQTPQQKSTAPETQQPETQKPGIHTAVVQEVIHVSDYTYLRVKENDADFWIAIRKTPMEPGETISYANPLEMRDFTSKELQRTFDKIFFISAYSKGDASTPATAAPRTRPAIDKKEISIAPAKDGISIGELFSNKGAYAGKTVTIKGQVVKFSAAIMKRNWVHIQDGTSGDGKHDLAITTQDEAAVGDIVTFEGKITLNKDFGAGYKYKVIMEEAKKK
ncbi:MAG: hypothetical protein J7M40_15680 [Planctomycetes bacterium]|nr:hypothetical protein [Planctomycetota bacterium]